MVDLQAKCATDEERKRDTRDDSRLVAGALKTTPTQQQATFFSSEMTILVEHATRSPDGPKTAARSFFFFLKEKSNQIKMRRFIQINYQAATSATSLSSIPMRRRLFLPTHSDGTVHSTPSVASDGQQWNFQSKGHLQRYRFHQVPFKRRGFRR